MYRMNVELTNNSVISIKSLSQEAVQDDVTDNNGENNFNLSNLYFAVLTRIERDKLYLNPSFSMQELSELMNRRERYLSQALSEVGKTSFPNLVNNLRINEARRLMAENPELSVFEIMNKTGFGSRQTFHRNFKQATGFTPSEYQERAKGALD